MAYVGAIDAGGTSWRCAIVDENANIVTRQAFKTTTPQETLALTADFFAQCRLQGFSTDTIGVACFGPLGVDPASSSWGYILETTKPHWSHTNVAGSLAQATGCTIAIETDVNAAALAEHAWGAGQGVDNLAYVTVGTGVGAGILLNGKPVWGALHPEAGHMRVPLHSQDLAFTGVCPFHGDCVEGLASAPALHARLGLDAAIVGDDHPVWDIEAHYLAHLAANLILTVALNRVIFGGGVCARAGLVERIAVKTKALIGPYSIAGVEGQGFDIVPAGLGLDAGLMGGAWLALRHKAQA